MVQGRIMSEDAFSPKERPIAEQYMLFTTDLLQLL